eukprot:GGOE01027178.1.p3 GENE.GGOE01027178.1~~GGOE01027178.1.p3  ORF type:complete len:122 (+),score=4.53 GGOE01027178.1:914-1279(+)
MTLMCVWSNPPPLPLLLHVGKLLVGAFTDNSSKLVVSLLLPLAVAVASLAPSFPGPFRPFTHSSTLRLYSLHMSNIQPPTFGVFFPLRGPTCPFGPAECPGSRCVSAPLLHWNRHSRTPQA